MILMDFLYIKPHFKERELLEIKAPNTDQVKLFNDVTTFFGRLTHVTHFWLFLLIDCQ